MLDTPILWDKEFFQQAPAAICESKLADIFRAPADVA
jgi:hypothetical protein